ncbi:hypothetical protein [Streptomyces sp. URMC 125]|uniref:hypothetical protein n=1 Tax=Streptomyces sp. URMC 125 TaxID=3423419 RepID=UPI003F1C7DA2
MEPCNRSPRAPANSFSDAGLPPATDRVIPDRDRLDFIVSLLPARRVLSVVLAPGIGVCRYRNTVRGPRERFDFDGCEGLGAGVRREPGEVGWWFDPADLTPEGPPTASSGRPTTAPR